MEGITDHTGGGGRALGVVMDDIGGIHPAKDTTLGLLEAAQRRGWRLFYFSRRGLFLHNGNACALAREVRVSLDNERWHEFTGDAQEMELTSLDAVLMRKDPPLDMEYFYTCQILEHAARAGVVVVNRPRGICTINEKILAQEFPGAFPETLVSCDMRRLAAFVERHRDTVIKPLDNMGGASVFRVQADDVNASVLLETMTRNSTRTVMLQALIPEYREGDKRILLIGGRPAPWALRRVPAAGELRANLAAGGSAEPVELEPGDVQLCERIAPRLNELELLFVGLDVIGGRLTEINVTSPTCARELDRALGLDITGQVIAAIESKIEAAGKRGGGR